MVAAATACKWPLLAADDRCRPQSYVHAASCDPLLPFLLITTKCTHIGAHQEVVESSSSAQQQPEQE